MKHIALRSPLGKYSDGIVVISPFSALLQPDTVILISSHAYNKRNKSNSNCITLKSDYATLLAQDKAIINKLSVSNVLIICSQVYHHHISC